jgi:hypothetical protein
VSKERIAVAGFLAAVLLLNVFHFPGRTWLQSDTQIYVPILDHIRDPHLFAKDIVATRPHVSWTAYDETALWLGAVTGWEYRDVLWAQQMLFRLCGLLGAYLVGRAFGLSRAGGLAVAAMFGLGAVINGPAVLTFEYEPVPRGFAVMLIVLACGFAAWDHWWVAGLAAGLATLYHPTTTAPFWLAAAVHWFVSHSKRERFRLFWPGLLAAAALLLMANMQRGETEPQMLWGRIGDDLMRLQQYRGKYNWITLWPRDWLWQYPLLFAAVVMAWRRLRDDMTAGARWFSLVLPMVGLASIPLSYLLLDVGRWVLVPQFQPARAALFVTAMCVMLCTAAAWKASSKGRWMESAAWFLIPFAVPLNGKVAELAMRAGQDELVLRRLLVCVALAGMAAGVAWVSEKKSAWAVTLFAGAFVLVPWWGQVVNYPPLHDDSLREVSEWARSSTPQDAVFLFADEERALGPGIFRAQAQRALYVDWKGGGQVNILGAFAREWGKRWDAVNRAAPPVASLERYRALGIDYIVVRPQNRPAGAASVFANAKWEVFATN